MSETTTTDSVLAIVPARYASSRLPGKPLAPIAGFPMIQWVFRRVAQCFPRVVVATDDARIAGVVEGFGGTAVLTSPNLSSGTARCAETLKQLQRSGHPWAKSAVVINIQGDEPFIETAPLQALAQAFADPSVSIATLAAPFLPGEDPGNPNRPKVVMTTQRSALYFSRALIPHSRDGSSEPQITHLKHIGVYAFRPEALQTVAELPPSPLEQIEKLEQLRWLEHGLSIRIVPISLSESIAVDTPEDLARANAHAVAQGLRP